MDGTNNTTDNDEYFPIIFGVYEALKSIARKLGDEQIVALKRISVDMMDEKAREKCLKEVRLLQSLDHPNIVRYMDSFICGNDLMIVYEWAAAGDLKRQLRKAQERGLGFEERVIWKYFSQISLAMQHMHDRRIMHRDLKPANIFLTLDGTIKVGDLGLSRELSEHTIQAHSKVGTPLYMSPEVLKGDGYGFKSDIWSMGCLLYELAMLKSPFKSEGLNLYSLFQKISNGEFQPLPDNYSEELRSLVYSMISTRPDDRPELSYVCDISQQMRTKTANDKSSKQKQLVYTTEPKSNKLNDNNDNNTNNNEEKNNNFVDNKTNNNNDQTIRTNKISDSEYKQNIDYDPYNNKSNASTPVMGVRPSNTNTNPYGSKYLNDNNEENDIEIDNNKNSKTAVSSTKLNNITKSNSFNDNKSDIIKSSKNINNKDINNNKTYIAEREDNISNKTSTKSLIENKESNGVYRRQKIPPNNNNNNNLSEINTISNKVETKSISPNDKLSKNSTSPTDLKFLEDDIGMKKNTFPQSNTTNSVIAQKISDNLIDSSPAIAVMEVVYAKLSMLGFPLNDPNIKSNYRSKDRQSRGRLLPFHFAFDLQLYPQIAGHDNGHQFLQFSRFVGVLIWLSGKVGGSVDNICKSINVEDDSPITVAKQILRVAQACGEEIESFSEISPTSLIPGHGLNVCNILNALSDAAMKSLKISDKKRVYPRIEDDIIQDEDNDNLDNDILDEVYGEVKEEVENEKEDGETIVSVSERGFLAVILTVGAIDPVLWKEETERVSKQLIHSKHQLILNDFDWNSHLQTLKDFIDLSNNESSKTNNMIVSTITKTQPKSFSFSHLTQNLKAVKDIINQNLLKIKLSENMLNSRDAVCLLSLNYSIHNKELALLRDKITSLNKSTESLSNNLSQLEDQQEELINELHKLDGSNSESGSLNPVIKIKDAIKQIKKEIIEMNISIHFYNHNLLLARTSVNKINRSKSIVKSKKVNNRDSEDFEY